MLKFGETEDQLATRIMLYERLQAAEGKRKQLPCDARPWGERLTMEPKPERVLNELKKRKEASAHQLGNALHMSTRDVSAQIQKLIKLKRVARTRIEYIRHGHARFRTYFYTAL